MFLSVGIPCIFLLEFFLSIHATNLLDLNYSLSRHRRFILKHHNLQIAVFLSQSLVLRPCCRVLHHFIEKPYISLNWRMVQWRYLSCLYEAFCGFVIPHQKKCSAFNLFSSKSAKVQNLKKTSFHKMLKNKQHHTKVLIDSSRRLVTNMKYGLNPKHTLCL